MSQSGAGRITRQHVVETADRLTNWGRWGKDDQIGTLNTVEAADIVSAASLVRKGKVFALGIPLNNKGPQNGLFGGRWNPIHTMLATGTDALAGNQDDTVGLRYSDDAINMPVQSATHWDALGHIFLGDKMYNGYPASSVDSGGVHQLGIEHTKNRMVGRGVLLDIARYKGVDHLEDGEAITPEDLDGAAAKQGVEIRKGDFVIFRTGQMERCLKEAQWGGYAGGDAPGLSFSTAQWLRDKDVAAICADTWGCEVRPNESTSDINQPWHWVVIPAIGLTMGEMFYLKELAEDCAQDGVYEFFFCAPPLVITGGTGSPINPQAIK